MPYIDEEARINISNEFAPGDAGQLNYTITMILLDYLSLMGESYQTYNDIIGVLECAKLELYRRKTVPYEEIKMLKNGDVF